MKFKVVLMSFLLALSSLSFAQYRNYFSPPDLQQQPSRILQSGFKRLQSYVENRQPSKGQLKTFVEKEISPYFDFTYMTKWSAGPHYKNLNQAQRDELEDMVKGMFYETLVSAVIGRDIPTIRFLPAKRGYYSNEMEAMAMVEDRANNGWLKMKFRLYKTDKGWKVFDVSAKGRSAIQYYRNHFKPILAQWQADNYKS